MVNIPKYVALLGCIYAEVLTYDLATQDAPDL